MNVFVVSFAMRNSVYACILFCNSGVKGLQWVADRLNKSPRRKPGDTGCVVDRGGTFLVGGTFVGSFSRVVTWVVFIAGVPSLPLRAFISWWGDGAAVGGRLVE